MGGGPGRCGGCVCGGGEAQVRAAGCARWGGATACCEGAVCVCASVCLSVGVGCAREGVWPPGQLGCMHCSGSCQEAVGWRGPRSPAWRPAFTFFSPFCHLHGGFSFRARLLLGELAGPWACLALTQSSLTWPRLLLRERGQTTCGSCVLLCGPGNSPGSGLPAGWPVSEGCSF